MEKIREAFHNLITGRGSYRKFVLSLAVVVVFVTTYQLVLPALALDKGKAAEQGGIDVPGIEAVSGDAASDAASAESGAESGAAGRNAADSAAGTAGSSKGNDGAKGTDSANVTNGSSGSRDVSGTDRMSGSGDASGDGSVNSSAENESGSADANSASKAANDGNASGTGSEADDASAPDSAENSGGTGSSDPLTYEGEDFNIAVTDINEILPADTEVKVEEIKESDDAEKYRQYFEEALKAVQDEKGSESISGFEFARFYDISLEADGTEVDPDDAVSVKIGYEKELSKTLSVENKDNVCVIHFAENKRAGEVNAEVLDADESKVEVVTDAKDRLTEASFEADSFSVYAIVNTSADSLSGKSYGIINTVDGTNPKGIAMLTTAANNNTRLQGKSTTVKVDPVSRADNVYVAANSTISMWTFSSIGGNQYYITVPVGNSLKYLQINSLGIKLVDDPDDNCKVTVTEGTGNYKGKYKFTSESGALKLNGTQFIRAVATDTGAGVWMNFAELSNLNDDDFVVYTAEKVSISGSEIEKATDTSITLSDGTIMEYDVNNGDQVIIYTRVWNENTLKYDYYAIDYDGKLIKAYESGDTISWVGSKVNTMLWDFTEYYYEDTNTPNYYYELQNSYSGKYIAPQVSHVGFLSDSTIGINLNGRRYNKYYSTILAWDDPYYDYASLRVKNYQLVSAPMSKAMDFYFAKMTTETSAGELTTVSTVDNTQYGITLKMQNYPYQGYYVNGGYRSKTQYDILGWTESSGSAVQGILTKNLQSDGYPVTTSKVESNSGYKGKSNTSLGELFKDTMDVNHQFLSGTYQETGYFEYDCTQNFAHLITDSNDPWVGQEQPDGSKYQVGDFVVYNQLGTTALSNGNSTQHGQFLPYNDLKYGENVKKARENLTDVHGNLLSSLDPRKGEIMYVIPASYPGNASASNPKFPAEDHVDYFFGMEMSASFMMSEDGLDDWGHDLIFEFSGDDDMWLYVDGMLVLDLGGTHPAVDGNVNFHTGKVVVNGRNTDLRTLYKEAYLENHSNASADEVNTWLNTIFKDDGTNTGTVFKDFTGHTMKMFYMERGANASNLHMRFNLSPYTDGEVQLEKEVTGADDIDTAFPFQIWYEVETTEGRKYVTWSDSEQVTDMQTGSQLTYQAYYSPAENLTYKDVFFLKPGQTASIKLPGEDTKYYIKECALDSGTFDNVKVNREVVSGSNAKPDLYNGTAVTDETGIPVAESLKDYTIAESEVSGRKKVIYENHVRESALKTLSITKRLWQEDSMTTEIHSGTGNEADNTEFRFRIYVGKDARGNYKVYNTGKYYVKDPDGNYCIYQDGGFVSTGKKDISELDTTVPDIYPYKSQLEQATFYTSPGGAADKIKAGYTIEIPGLMAGTEFKIEERDYEIPAGYKLLRYTLTNGKYTSENPGKNTGEGVIAADSMNTTVSVHNQHGYGLTVNKNWSDAAFMTSHDDIYFAVYLKGEGGTLSLVENSLRRMRHPATSLSWFFPELEDGKTLNDYLVYEVELNVPEGSKIAKGEDGNPKIEISESGAVTKYTTVNAEGIETEYPVSGETITKKEDNENIDIGGVTNEHGYAVNYTYTVSYHREELNNQQIADKVNSRIDAVSNARPGVKIVKTDLRGSALAGAKFTLTDSSGSVKKTFTSDENGLVAVAYLESGKEYKLSETAAPYGYQSLIDKLTIKVTVDKEGINTIYVNNQTGSPENDYYSIEQLVTVPTASDMPTVTIKNKYASLKAVKVDSASKNPIAGVQFALYKEVFESGTNNPMPDYTPMSGYDNLVTGSDGIIPGIVLKNRENANGLSAGKYYLRETETPSGYKSLGSDIRITISETGMVTLEKATGTMNGGKHSWTFADISPDLATLTTESTTGAMTITVKNDPKDPVRIRKLEMGTKDKYLEGVKFNLYKVGQISNGKPKEGEIPVLSGETDKEGVLTLGGLEENTSYYLFETETLDGYNLLEAPVVISTVGSNTINASLNNSPLTCDKTKTDGVWEITVYNSTGVELPSTGGVGTTLFYILGTLLLLGGAIALIARHRANR